MEPAQTARGPVDAETHPVASSGEIAGIEVPGGTLAVERFRSGTEPVLAIHGISSQRRLWNWLRAAAPGLTPEALPAIFRDRLARLERDWSYLAHDLVDHRVRLSAGALVADAADVFFGPSKWPQLGVPTRFLTAEALDEQGLS